MKIKNLSADEASALVELLTQLAMGNTEYDDLTKKAEAMLDDMGQRRTRLANALRALVGAALELNDAWDALPHFHMRFAQPAWFPSFPEMAQDLDHWVNCNLADLDPLTEPQAVADPHDLPNVRLKKPADHDIAHDDIPF